MSFERNSEMDSNKYFSVFSKSYMFLRVNLSMYNRRYLNVFVFSFLGKTFFWKWDLNVWELSEETGNPFRLRGWAILKTTSATTKVLITCRFNDNIFGSWRLCEKWYFKILSLNRQVMSTLLDYFVIKN